MHMLAAAKLAASSCKIILQSHIAVEQPRMQLRRALAVCLLLVQIYSQHSYYDIGGA
jgi:hypothetical protein